MTPIMPTDARVHCRTPATPKQRRLALGSAVLAAALAACAGADSDSGTSGGSGAHGCGFSYSSSWRTTDLYLDHSEPRRCPIPIRYRGEVVRYAAHAIDPDGDDVFNEEIVDLTIRSYPTGGFVGGDRDYWTRVLGYNQLRAFVDSYYEASREGGPEDIATITTFLTEGRGRATASVSITVDLDPY